MSLAIALANGVFSARYGGRSAASDGDSKLKGERKSRAMSANGDEGEWMQRARKLANQRAAQFRKERGAPPVAPAPWRRKRKTEKGDEAANAEWRSAARAYDDLPGRRVSEDEEEMTAAAGDGLWRVDMAGLSEEDWATQWTMTVEEWRVVKKDVSANARTPSEALRGFEDAGLRRVSPDIAAGMLRVVADKAKSSRADREELAGLRRDSRVAHLIGTCVAAARRGSEALAPASASSAAWAVALIAGERANAAEMEVLAERCAVLVDAMTPRQTADLAWALASCRHSSRAVFRALDARFASDAGLAKYKPYDVSTLAWAFAHLGGGGAGFVDGLDRWFSGGVNVEEVAMLGSSEADAELAATASKNARTFTPHALAATAWGLTVLGGDATRSFSFRAVWAELARRGSEIDSDESSDESSDSSDVVSDATRVTHGPWMGKHLNQIHQAIVSVDALGGPEASGLVALPASLVAAAEAAWTAQRRPPVTSWYQRDVASILSYMGAKHEEEATCAGYRVDLLIPDARALLGEALPVAVEVDGPSHFARNDPSVALGQTRLKHRQLRALGFAVLSVPVADWEYLETSEEKVEYLREGFDAAAASEA